MTEAGYTGRSEAATGTTARGGYGGGGVGSGAHTLGARKLVAGSSGSGSEDPWGRALPTPRSTGDRDW